jgi:S-adenosylmethionine-diacylgycerolhomoserine-N-methlytransferase
VLERHMSEAATTSHAFAMDRMYRYTRHIYDLTRKPYLLGRDRLIAELGLEAGGTVLEMGCGTGRNLIAVARAYPQAELYGFDISEEMLKTARTAVRLAGFGDRIHLRQGDAATFDAAAAFGRDVFDRVYFSYALSMIPPWRAAVVRGLALTNPGGRFSVVDFGFCEGLGGVPRALLHRWLKLFDVTPRAELEDELKALARNRGRQFRFERPFRGYAQLATVG